MIAAWVDGMWAATVRGGIALLIIWVLCHIRQMPVRVRCWMWRAAYAVVLIPLVWTTPMKLPLLRAASVSVEQNKFGSGQAPTALMQSSEPAQAMPVTIQPRPAITSGYSTGFLKDRLPEIAFALWIVFLAGYVGQLAISWWQAQRLRCGKPLDFSELAELCRRMDIHRPPMVQITSAVRGPLLIGLWRPVIVLPESMAGSAHLKLVLAHELAHLKRLDLLWNWLPTLAMAALPLHPMVWICNRQWRFASEAACDAEAIAAAAVRPAEYGRVLINMAITPQPRAQGVLAVAVVTESRWLLKQRLSAMATTTQWNRRRLATAGLILGIFAIIGAVPWRVVAQQTPAATQDASAGTRPPSSTMPVIAPATDSFNAVGLGTVTMHSANIRTLTSGTIERVDVTDGQRVKKGDLLFQLESKSQEQAVASAAQIEKTSAEHYSLVQGQYKTGVATVAELSEAKLDLEKAQDTLQQRQATLDRMKIIAPFDGTLGLLQTSVGNTILPGDPLAVIVDTTQPGVEFTVPEEYVHQVKVGSPIEITNREMNKTIGQGEIVSAGSDVDPATGTVRFRAKLDAPNQSLISGGFVNVRFHRETAR